MEKNWYHAEGQGTVGPISIEQLRETLHSIPNWRDVLVWKEGFENWRKAGDVVELAIQPPPLPHSVSIPSPSAAAGHSTKPTMEPEKKKSAVGKIAGGALTVIVALVAVVIGRELGHQGYQVVATAIQTPQERNSLINQGFQQAKVQLDAKLPTKIDDSTTLTSVRVEDATLVYIYRVEADRIDID